MEKTKQVAQANICAKYGITREELQAGVDEYAKKGTAKYCGDTMVLLAIIELLTSGDIAAPKE